MYLPHSQLLSTVLAGRKGLIVGIANAAKAITGDTHYVDGGVHILA
jgi:hypothetical protein